MIHLIYIYFIINAFLAGERYIWDGWKYSIYLLLFAIPHYIIFIILVLFKAFKFLIESLLEFNKEENGI